jgi:hypothetical protein
VWCGRPKAAQRGGTLDATVAFRAEAHRASQMSCPVVPDVSISCDCRARWARTASDHDWMGPNGWSGHQQVASRPSSSAPHRVFQDHQLGGHCPHTPGALVASCIRYACRYDTRQVRPP